MCTVLPEKGNLETNIKNYLNCSYSLGYNLNSYFSEKQQIIMFERLLSCDTNFKQEWENGLYSIPEDPTKTMYLASYIKKQSTAKKLSRKLSTYIYNEKLIEGAKNLLQGYMIELSQDYTQDKKRNMNTTMEEMFCGIMKQIKDRKQSYVEQKVPVELAHEITGYGGTKRKTRNKKNKKNKKKRNKTLKMAKGLKGLKGLKG